MSGAGVYAGTGPDMYYLWHANEIGASADGRRDREPFAANYSPSLFKNMEEMADLVMIDIKHMDSAAHRRNTGVGNERILSNIRRLMAGERSFIARIPLIPGVNDDPANLEAAAGFLSGAKALLRVELMPYNVLAGAKYRAVGLEYRPGFTVDASPKIDLRRF